MDVVILTRRQILLSAAGLAKAQQPERSPNTFSMDVKVINVLATVRDRQGNIIRNLSRENFRLEDDGVAQEIKYFSRQSDLALTLGMLIDTSGSQIRVLGEEQRASFRFLRQVLREDKDTAFVIRFDFDVELLQDLTSSRDRLEQSLSSLEAASIPQMRRRAQMGGGGVPPRRRRGGTALYDAVLLASDELMRKQPGRKAFILLSDGVDTGSRVSISSAIEAAQRADTLVYTIRFFDNKAFRANTPIGKKVLQRLAEETGGGYFDVSEKQPLQKVFRQIEDELRNQYNLGFTPSKADTSGAFHRIRLTTNQKNALVQTRGGYYASAKK
ncbi:MAG: VWA domain-containing protein [Candidatus Solibacter usitatus]|nr:VWA domain-containing protein [Candidatus Solibacter usitatus]